MDLGNGPWTIARRSSPRSVTADQVIRCDGRWVVRQYFRRLFPPVSHPRPLRSSLRPRAFCTSCFCSFSAVFALHGDIIYRRRHSERSSNSTATASMGWCTAARWYAVVLEPRGRRASCLCGSILKRVVRIDGELFSSEEQHRTCCGTTFVFLVMTPSVYPCLFWSIELNGAFLSNVAGNREVYLLITHPPWLFRVPSQTILYKLRTEVYLLTAHPPCLFRIPFPNSLSTGFVQSGRCHGRLQSGRHCVREGARASSKGCAPSSSRLFRSFLSVRLDRLPDTCFPVLGEVKANRAILAGSRAILAGSREVRQ